MPIDYSKYPPSWKTEIRPAILKRANNCCEFCGVENGSMQWRGRKKVREGKRLKNRTFSYPSEEAALADGCNYLTVGPRKGVYKEIGIYQTKVVLTIAHLDHDEENWDVEFDRLAALCQLCHLQYDAKEKYRRANYNALTQYEPCPK
jgi:hypothetical protein